ncbi:mechanosensitive ion channel family protein [Aquimarina sp. 2201CG5-10]|uniref:mechanosensitive ion channel family protein n=1 Tax=Aquimarina callyspongiae TaxID=3098150 RepID=UPI002AB49274|nr:small-conductance mechanosensitive channel [Aquimarina sp. 2201CG5-10]MDY8134928.1 small-conductance mechanosensitive channel [Aquimarina sp. 2201CG5-10]
MEKLLDFKLPKNIFDELYSVLPNILGAIIFFFLSWFIIKVILFVVKKSLGLTKIDSLTSKIGENGVLFNSSINIKPTQIITTFIKWFLILVLVIVGSDLFGLTIVSNEAGRLIDYLPKIFSAIVIFGFGLYLASLIKKSVYTMLKSFDLSGSKIISSILFFIIFVIVSITALNQVGINTDIITNNLSLILGAFLAAFTIALGLGSRDIIYRLLLGFYTRKNLEIRQKIKVDGFEGVIISIDNISIVIENNEGHKTVYPIKLIANKKIEIIE